MLRVVLEQVAERRDRFGIGLGFQLCPACAVHGVRSEQRLGIRGDDGSVLGDGGLVVLGRVAKFAVAIVSLVQQAAAGKIGDQFREDRDRFGGLVLPAQGSRQEQQRLVRLLPRGIRLGGRL